MSLVFTLGARNLFHDRLRFIATVIGIVFSIVLVTVQMGLYLGFGRMVTTMIDRADADLWIMPRGTKCFEDPSLLDVRGRNRALETEGVAQAIPVVIGFSDWRMPSGAMTPVFVVGSDLKAGGLVPWNVVEGSLEALGAPRAVAVDRTYFDRLGIAKLGDGAEIRGQAVRVAALTEGIRSFTTTPYVFMNVDRARAHTGVPQDKATYILVRLKQGAELEAVRDRLRANVPDVEVLTSAEFAKRSHNFWLFGTGAGAGLFFGAILGVIVGTVIVAQTLYSSTKDHINEFATLRAIGSSRGYIRKVILWQAALSAVIGFSIAALIGFVVVRLTENGALPIVLTPGLMIALFTR
jgi:putative ABC transport system permease protein